MQQCVYSTLLVLSSNTCISPYYTNISVNGRLNRDSFQKLTATHLLRWYTFLLDTTCTMYSTVNYLRGGTVVLCTPPPKVHECFPLITQEDTYGEVRFVMHLKKLSEDSEKTIHSVLFFADWWCRCVEDLSPAHYSPQRIVPARPAASRLGRSVFCSSLFPLRPLCATLCFSSSAAAARLLNSRRPRAWYPKTPLLHGPLRQQLIYCTGNLSPFIKASVPYVLLYCSILY